jgi:hypothetical protein
MSPPKFLLPAIGDGFGVCVCLSAGYWVDFVLLLHQVSSLRPPPATIFNMDVNGDTASLKKRKREPKDDPALSQKKHRRQSKSKLQANANADEDASASDGQNPSKAALQQTGGDLELPDASSQSLAVSVRERLASWKVSKPMGGRMLDIDPVFSPDER